MELNPQQQIAENFDPVDAVLRRCFDLLTVQDFAGCRKHAQAVFYNLSRKHPRAIQALGIADVLIAAKKRLRGGQLDWYSILQVDPATPPKVVAARAYKLLFFLHPIRNKFPFARSAAGLVMYAWRVLSDPASKAKYDSLVAPPPPPATPATFRTACPYCCHIFEDEIVYKDHSVRCRSYWEACLAAAFHEPPPESLKVGAADGRVEEAYHRPKEQFKSKPGVTGVEKSTERPNSASGVKKSAENSNNTVGLVSDDELTGLAGGGISSNGNEGEEVRVEEVGQEEQRPSKKMRVMSSAKNTEKIMGRSGVEEDPVPVPVPTPQADFDDIEGFWSEILRDSWSKELKLTLDEDHIYVIDPVGCTDDMDDPLTSRLEQTNPEGTNITSPFWVQSLDEL